MEKKSFLNRLSRWYLGGGVMKVTGRTVTLLAVIAALVIAGVGVNNMFTAAKSEQQEAYATAYAKQQRKEYRLLQRAAQQAEKDGTEVPFVPESESDLVLENPPVVALTLENQWAGFFTGEMLQAMLVLVAGVFLGWCIGSLPTWIASMKAAGPVRVTAGTFYWGGAAIAMGFLFSGLWKVLLIEKSTLPEITGILTRQYVIWAVIALGAGVMLRWLILHLVPTQQKAFANAGSKLRLAGKGLFYATLILMALMLIGAVCAFVLAQWWLCVGLIVGAVALLAAGWITSLALEGLGTCTLIMAPQVKEAEDREYALLHATSWYCPSCGNENLKHIGECPHCGASRPHR